MGSIEQGSSSVPVVIAPPTTATQKTSGGKCQGPNPNASTGGGKRPGGTRRARGAGAVKETFLHYVIPCFQAVSIYNLDIIL